MRQVVNVRPAMASTDGACKIAILTVSDRCFQQVYEDKTGAWLKNAILQPTNASATDSFTGVVVAYHVVPDEQQAIIATLTEWCDNKTADIILTNGGTGFTQRDVTPEATLAVIERTVYSIPAIMAVKFYPLSLYSRQIAGVRNRTLIVNLPGSTTGARECYELIRPVLNHICNQLRDDTPKVRADHGEMSSKTADEGKNPSSTGFRHHCSHKHNQDDATSRVDATNVAGRSRKSPFPLIEVDEAVKIVLEHAAATKTDDSKSKNDETSNIEEVSLQKALNRTCACNLHAREPLPPFPASIKDGYAVIAADGAGVCHVIGENAAGDQQTEKLTVTPGACVRINTGAPMPPGADAVVQVEDTRLMHASDDGKRELKIEILVAAKVGQDIRPIGSDIAIGTQILSENQRISVWDLGVLATCGIIRIPVYKRPRIALLSTGNELVPPDSDVLPPGCIRNANESSLRALLRTHNYADDDCVVYTDIARDTPDDTCRAFRRAFTEADVVISTGGVSMGDRDCIKQVLQQDFQATIHFAQVRMKPGKPTTFATCEFEGKKKLVFGLPGNPVSALVTAYLYVLPALKKMSGEKSCCLARAINCVCRERIQLDARPEFHRAMLLDESDEISGLPVAVSTGSQISSRLLSFSNAQVLLKLPAASEKKQWIEVGERIEAMVIG